MKKRYDCIDALRGITLVSMVAYHTVWDLVYIIGLNWKWYHSDAAYVWQQSICWIFILLSGFCWSIGNHRLKRGITVSGAGILISLVTGFLDPQQRVLFGVMTFLGACMLVMIPLEKLLKRVPSAAGLSGSVGLFLITRNVNRGFLGFESANLIRIPEEWYHKGYFMTALGFTDVSFYSADYFSFMPWFFLFAAGYFLFRIAEQKRFLEYLSQIPVRIKPFTLFGRHSLPIYILHQPVIYFGLLLLDRVVDI